MKKAIKYILAILVLILSGVLISLQTSKHALTVGRYELAGPGLTAPLRIVQLTDLHNSEFGEGNERLIRRVAEQEPDLILITGDLLNSDEARTDIAETLLRGLSPIAPVYVSYGNHEKEHERRWGSDLRAKYTECGATVLEYDWLDVELKGQKLRLGGLYGYCLPAKYLSTGEAWQEECDYLADFQNTDRLKLLLCHMPVCWQINGSLDAWDVDLVLAGHVHGGQVRFPLVGGLWSPDRNWFPGRESGLYRSADGAHTLVLSRGLGSREKIPRFNNVPEILVLDLLPDEIE